MKYPKFEIIKLQKEGTIQIKENALIDISLDKITGYCDKEGDRLFGLIEIDDAHLIRKSFWLNNKYNWVIVQDKDGDPCLVPLKKEK